MKFSILLILIKIVINFLEKMEKLIIGGDFIERTEGSGRTTMENVPYKKGKGWSNKSGALSF